MIDDPDIPAKNTLSIVHITDLHILAKPESRLLGVDTRYSFNEVLQLALTTFKAIDLVLLTGDLAQDPVAESYSCIVRTLDALQISCLCLPGNHDDVAVMSSVLNSAWVSCKPDTHLSNWQLICLNSQVNGSEKGHLADAELIYLERCLSHGGKKNVLIAVHHHVLPTESAWLDTMIIDNYPRFWSLITAYPQVKLVVNGHIHQEMDVEYKGVRVLATPSTCFQFKPKSVHFGLDNKPPGFRFIELTAPGQLSTRVVRLPHALEGLEMTTKGY
ncbi:MAG: 3',5'-cyclic-AMP phosphodiesterase [Methylovulum sp.]|nr:3',5'-cyclic-AMP phosphodiesterase [Methylovulum sp.]